MTPRDIEQMVEVLASTLPASVDLESEQAVAEYLTVTIGNVHGYRRSIVGDHIPAIIERAKNLKLARAI